MTSELKRRILSCLEINVPINTQVLITEAFWKNITHPYHVISLVIDELINEGLLKEVNKPLAEIMLNTDTVESVLKLQDLGVNIK